MMLGKGCFAAFGKRFFATLGKRFFATLRMTESGFRIVITAFIVAVPFFFASDRAIGYAKVDFRRERR
jgi:hypothetical protein